MIRSMTGFGEASANAEGTHYFIELRSLNNKYLKTNIRLPDDLQSLEAEIEPHIRRRINRGSVTAILKVSDTSASAAMTVNHDALQHYVEQVRQTPAVQSGELTLALGPLLELPGVLQPPADDEARLDRARAAIRGILDKACDHLISMREREGAFLVEDLMKHHNVIETRLALITEHAPSAAEEYEARLKARVDSMLEEAGHGVEPVDIIREVAVYAEKTDISEEVSRLGGHLEHYQEMLASTEDRPIGRTLDFLAQEMLREANTIASKSADTTISRAIVDIKGAIDRIKEQVQNVE
ncbi:MAG: YicC family protein [Parvularculaceae bacterium]|nr:YicC family protein [Parvularculaceae bacterium]